MNVDYFMCSGPTVSLHLISLGKYDETTFFSGGRIYSFFCHANKPVLGFSLLLDHILFQPHPKMAL